MSLEKSSAGEIVPNVASIPDAPAADFMAQFGLSAPREQVPVTTEPLQDSVTGKIADGKPEVAAPAATQDGQPANKVVTVEAPGQLDMSALDPVESTTAAADEATQEITAPATVTTAADEARAKSRDLSGYTPAEQQLLRRMSNETWAFVKPQLDAAKKAAEIQTQLEEAQKSKDSWMFGHEESYKLLPEYQSYTSNVESLNVEEQWWKQQFINLRSGREAQDLNINGNDQLVAGNSLGKGADAELYVQGKMQSVVSLRSQLASQFANWRADHQTQVTGVRGQVEKIHNSLFGKDLPAPVKAGADKMLSWLPKNLAGQTEYKIIAGLYGYVQAAQQQIVALKAQVQGRNVVAAASQQTGPSQLSGGGGDGGVNDNTSVADAMKLIRSVGVGR